MALGAAVVTVIAASLISVYVRLPADRPELGQAQRSPPPPPPLPSLPPLPSVSGPRPVPTPAPPPPPSPLPSRRRVWWHAPFFSGGGMGAEALQLVLGLQRHTEFADRLWITSHGDVDSYELFAGLRSADQADLLRMLRGARSATWASAAAAIIVCHSEPGAWALPEPLYQTALCPPVPVDQAAYVVARAMFESDRVSPDHVKRCNQMSEVWVPTEFHRATFAASGVHPSKLHVVPEPVDVAEFDPRRHKPLPLPLGTHVFGPAWLRAEAEENDTAPGSSDGHGGGSSSSAGAGSSSSMTSSSSSGSSSSSSSGGGRRPFLFLFVGKWESRKGWDVLLRAYLAAFTADDPVMLLMHTKPFHSEANFDEQMEAWVRQELPAAAASMDRLPSVYVLGDHIPQLQYPRLYRTADAFVLPTRGEGWGLPVVEAMAMQLPVIVTNWSGPTAYLDKSVGYPLSWQLEEVPPGTGAFSGHRWAQPSARHLGQLMRHVVEHREEAAGRGRAARQRMQEQYSPAAVAEILAQQLRRIELQLA